MSTTSTSKGDEKSLSVYRNVGSESTTGDDQVDGLACEGEVYKTFKRDEKGIMNPSKDANYKINIKTKVTVPQKPAKGGNTENIQTRHVYTHVKTCNEAIEGQGTLQNNMQFVQKTHKEDHCCSILSGDIENFKKERGTKSFPEGIKHVMSPYGERKKTFQREHGAHQNPEKYGKASYGDCCRSLSRDQHVYLISKEKL